MGLFERIEGDTLRVSRVTFGTEPKDCEVLAYVLEHYHELTFSPPVSSETRERADNPKRRQRAAAKETQTASAPPGLFCRGEAAPPLKQCLASLRHEKK